ncbi:hypothetical protein NM688_g4173 [Phlebia brevispora]|uniref:Uncharacterized protein n=1 Tax=Phlebia brevispora TaxID=194682 RepID=A0ACC1T3H9_9APHY|nr:hypothetical protein NM688_g4173 [Phlebia brevispora]
MRFATALFTLSALAATVLFNSPVAAKGCTPGTYICAGGYEGSDSAIWVCDSDGKYEFNGDCGVRIPRFLDDEPFTDVLASVQANDCFYENGIPYCGPK